MSIISHWFRPRPVVVNTFKTRKTDLERIREAKTAQLARELGRPNPLDPAEAAIDDELARDPSWATHAGLTP